MRRDEEEIVCDFRKFYQISAFDVPQKIRASEALILLRGLYAEQGSRIIQKKNGWASSLSKEEFLLTNIFDLKKLEIWANSDPKRRGSQPEALLDVFLGKEKDNKIAGSKMSISRAKELYKIEIKSE